MRHSLLFTGEVSYHWAAGSGEVLPHLLPAAPRLRWPDLPGDPEGEVQADLWHLRLRLRLPGQDQGATLDWEDFNLKITIRCWWDDNQWSILIMGMRDTIASNHWTIATIRSGDHPWYISSCQTIKVDAIDDNEELEYTEDAFNVLGFSARVKKFSLFKKMIS